MQTENTSLYTNAHTDTQTHTHTNTQADRKHKPIHTRTHRQKTQAYTHTHTQTDKHTHTQTHPHIDKHTPRKHTHSPHKHTHTQTHPHIGRQTHIDIDTPESDTQSPYLQPIYYSYSVFHLIRLWGYWSVPRLGILLCLIYGPLCNTDHSCNDIIIQLTFTIIIFSGKAASINISRLSI